MVTLVPSSTQPIPGGSSQPQNVTWTGQLKAGDILTLHIASATRDVGVARTDYDGFVIRKDFETAGAVFNPNCLYTQTNLTFTFTIQTGGVYFVCLLGGGFPLDSSHGTAFGYTLELTPFAPTFCQHGTEPKNPLVLVQVVTQTLIDSILARLGMSWASRLFAGFLFQTYDLGQLCGTGPPSFDPVDRSVWTAGLIELKMWFDALMWNEFCQCRPGTPTPIPFPPPTQNEPAGGPPPISFPCDPSALCASLVAIQQQLAALSQTLGRDYELDTLVQRYQSPFEFIKGAVHSNVSTSGSFQVSRLIGVQVEVTELVGERQSFTGVPVYIADLGWLSLLTGDGLIDEIRLTRTRQIWLPRLMPLADSFGIALREGVTVRITELQAEP